MSRSPGGHWDPPDDGGYSSGAGSRGRHSAPTRSGHHQYPADDRRYPADDWEVRPEGGWQDRGGWDQRYDQSRRDLGSWRNSRDDGGTQYGDDAWSRSVDDDSGSATVGQDPSGPRPRRRGRGVRRRGPVRRFLRRWRMPILAVLVSFSLVVGWSVVRALTIPGGGTVAERLAEWARGHYLNPVVTLFETLGYQAPHKGGKANIPTTGPAAQVAAKKHPMTCPHRLKSLARTQTKHEGTWRVLATVHGQPAVCGTYLVASPVYTSYVSGIGWINQKLVKFELRPGSLDPGPGNWHAQPWIPPGTRRGLLATFNSGFKIDSAGGGFYLNGATVGTLTKGAASVVYYRDGHMAIGVWGSTVHMTPDVVGVRQNLHLIVVNGHIPNTVDQNVETSWGATLGGSYYVWRSGIGITKSGQIVFAYGPDLNVREIARLLQRAGAVTGMQLDINPEWMSFMYYLPKHHPNNPTPYNLLPSQNAPPNRYYSINGRDFTAVYAR